MDSEEEEDEDVPEVWMYGKAIRADHLAGNFFICFITVHTCLVIQLFLVDYPQSNSFQQKQQAMN